jgi:hypothetical protein
MKTDNIFGNRFVAYARAFEHRSVELLQPNQELDPGAHVVTPWYGFAHHGIYAGDGKVIHYGALVYDLIRRPVEEVTLGEFAEGRPIFIVTHAEAVFEVEEVLRRARSRIGENAYRLMSNNCEHFAEWCLHGVHRSFQAESVLDFPRRAGEWWRARAFGLLRKWGQLPFLGLGSGPITSTPTRAPEAASARARAGRSARSPAQKHTDSDSPWS